MACARGARQAELQCALHDAQARRRDRSRHADPGVIGSGPFIFKRDEWKAGREGGLRQEPEIQAARRAGLGWPAARSSRSTGSNGSGSPTRRPQVNALMKGEIDLLEIGAARPARLLEGRQERQAHVTNPPGRQYALRFNSLHPPFNNPKVRQAGLCAGAEGIPRRQCRRSRLLQGMQVAVPVRHAAGTTKGREGKLDGNVAKAEGAAAEAGYDGTPVVLLHQTDTPATTTSPRSPRPSSRRSA